MAPITLDKVTKVYPNGFKALHELELSIREGEFMVLVGPSGCGKTTALRLVAGLEEITEGRLLIGDRVVNDVEPKDRDIAMVFQNYALYPNMTVKGNIGFSLKLRGVPAREIEARVTEATELLGLTEWADRKPSQLSGGQRQRVAMGRAIVREPSAFLMDEPLSNLDAKLRTQMRAEVARIQRRLGVATLYVTHDQIEAMTMGDRVAVLSAGVLQQCDEPRVIYDRPRNLFVAGFMGSPAMNLFEAVIGEGLRTLTVGSQQIVLPESVRDAIPALSRYAGRPIVLGVRPEDLVPVGAGGDRELSVLEGAVELVEPLGSEQLVHFTTDARAVEVHGAKDDDAGGLGEGTIRRGGEGVARVDRRAQIVAGTRVRFSIEPGRLRFFDPASTEAVFSEPPAERPRTGARAGGAVWLSADTVNSFAAKVQIPKYDRGKLTGGIVHFGVGGFHRAHQAMYVDRLLNSGAATDWGICGIGLMPSDREMRQALGAQDHLYTLVEKHAGGEFEASVIGSLIDLIYAPQDTHAALTRLTDERTQIVSLTITEGGYGIDDVTGKFSASGADITADLQPDATPRTVFGLIVGALAARRKAGIAPFTVVSCDNLQGNGALAREAFVAFATLRDPGLGQWIEQNVCFPNSMVDRITPATTDKDREEVAARFGINDRWPVVCEPFTQWVLEDAFTMGRPPFEEAGVQIVSEVAPYELMKLRLLNASHQGMCYFGRLCGYTYVHEAAQDPLFSEFLLAYMDLEATPSLDPVPGVDLRAYKDNLIERFSNPEIRDTIARLCADSSDRIPKWLLPVIRFQLERGGPIALSAAIVASWARYAQGADEQGGSIEVVDRRRAEVMAAAARQAQEPTAFIENRELFGDLASNDRFVDAYLTALRSLHERGARRTLEVLMNHPVKA